MAISDGLLEGELTFKTISTWWEGGGGLKSEDFRGNVIYGWPCGLNLEQLKNILSKFLISWLHKFAEKLNQGKIRNIDHSNILRLNQFAETVARRCSIQKCS